MWAEAGCRNHAAEITGIIKPEEQKQEWRVVKMIRILAIGNSFSEDATYYLHQILEAAGVENLVVNLFIGGCQREAFVFRPLPTPKLYVKILSGRIKSVGELLHRLSLLF